MANEITISNIKAHSAKLYEVDWFYGTDDNTRGLSTTVDLSSLALADRQNAEKIKEYLKTHLHESVFTDLDNDIASNPENKPVE
tara:strand:- start:290 stop:541 length:252 start_codon:yes stop_codon:yes gene_type:complete